MLAWLGDVAFLFLSYKYYVVIFVNYPLLFFFLTFWPFLPCFFLLAKPLASSLSAGSSTVTSSSGKTSGSVGILGNPGQLPESETYP